MEDRFHGDDPITGMKMRGEDEEFERALGQFMIAWADAEAELLRVLIHYTRVSKGIGRAIFSGTRAKAMIDFMRNVIHNEGMPENRASDLEHVFAQMVLINTMRDHLIHHVSDSYSFKETGIKSRSKC